MFPPFHWWRTVFWLIPMIGVYTLVLGALSLISMLVDRHGFFAHRCARAWSYLILVTTGVRVRVRGQERVCPNKSYVFVSNHQSIYDFPVLITSIPNQLRIIAKASLGLFPVLGWHLRYTGHLLIDRARSGKTTLENIGRLMQRGHSLIVFPEGTRSTDGEVLKFKRGLFSLAIDCKLPIVPVAVVGSRHVMRKGRLMTCPGDVEIVIHDPLSTEDLERHDARALADQTREIIVTSVSDTARRIAREAKHVVREAELL